VELESQSKRIDLDAMNKTLETELEGVDRMAKNLQGEKEMALVRADREVNESRVELEKMQRELDDLEPQLEQMRAVSSNLAILFFLVKILRSCVNTIGMISQVENCALVIAWQELCAHHEDKGHCCRCPCYWSCNP
jgi:chromosome segregation ATPase